MPICVPPFLLCHTPSPPPPAAAPLQGPACKGLTPPSMPSHGGSQQFIYNAEAVLDFRRQVLVPFMVAFDPKITAAAMYKALDAVQGKQVGATLRLLSPLNTIPVYQFGFKVVA